MRRPARTLLLAAALILAAFAVLALSPRPHTAETFAMGSFVTQTVYGPKGEEAAALARQLRDLDLNTITPLEALNLLYQLKRKAEG